MGKKSVRTGDILTVHVGGYHVEIKVSGSGYNELWMETISTKFDGTPVTEYTRRVELYG